MQIKWCFSGNKLEDKIYINFSGYPGGKKEETAKNLLKRRPEAVLERAVKGMLPKNRLGRKMYQEAVCLCRNCASSRCTATEGIKIFKFLFIMEKQKLATGRRKEAVTRIFLTRGRRQNNYQR